MTQRERVKEPQQAVGVEAIPSKKQKQRPKNPKQRKTKMLGKEMR
jgi:hypothetical protein